MEELSAHDATPPLFPTPTGLPYCLVRWASLTCSLLRKDYGRKSTSDDRIGSPVGGPYHPCPSSPTCKQSDQ